jgi:glyoxylate carboligase
MGAKASIAKQVIHELPATEDRFPRGAEILVEALVHEGVDSIFGYPGGAVLHIYDELWRARDRITHYLVRHEQAQCIWPRATRALQAASALSW